jgi:hypothetical protein
MLNADDLGEFTKSLEDEPVLAGSNLTILMGGLALGHQQKDRWQSVFLTSIPNHDLKMKAWRIPATEVGHKPKPIEIANNQPITITPQGIQYWTSRDQNNGKWDLGNLADFSKLHEEAIRFRRPDKMSLTRIEVLGGHGFTALRAPSSTGRPNYWFNRRGQTPESSPRKRFLGTWLGISFKIKPGQSVDVRGRSGRLHSSILNEHSRVIIEITNNCQRSEGCTEELDFPYYYYDSGRKEKGVIANTPIDMHTDEIAIRSQEKRSIDERTGDRIACNKMMISDLGGLSSLFDLEG